MDEKTPYPKPGAIGGTLIRKTVSALKNAGLELPSRCRVFIACSGGPDSVALAHLVSKYGRRIVPQSAITLVHIDHHWDADSSQVAQWVESLAQKLNVGFQKFDLDPPKDAGESLEEVARARRKVIFAALGSTVLTAHNADDLAETLLWRLFTGASQTHGAGILQSEGVEVRPFLEIRKKELQAYLSEEGMDWKNDPSNQNSRFLRVRVRKEILPAIEAIFPRAVQHLVKNALKTQSDLDSTVDFDTLGPELLFGVQGLKARRAHWETIKTWSEGKKTGGDIHLPGGWKLSKEPRIDRWILERR